MIAPPTHVQEPSNARRKVVAFGMALAFISYLDRACISQAAPMIARDLHFNTIQMGYIFSAFGLTYAAMEVPSGWLIARLLFGAGEAGCFPGLAKTFSNWLPAEERARAEGWKACSARWGAAAAPLFVVALYASLGWRATLVLFGAIGLVWAAFFSLQFRDRPNHGFAIVAGRPTWRMFLRSRSAWVLCLQWFCHFYGFYFYVT